METMTRTLRLSLSLFSRRNHILAFVRAEAISNGVRLSAVKFLQRVIVVQTPGVVDPRLQNKNDPNTSFCPPDHPFIQARALEDEGKKLFEGILTILYRSKNVDLLSALLNSLVALIKQRPALVQFIVTALAQWEPTALQGLPASNVKSVEKALRILLIHISRTPQGAPHIGLINDALSKQGIRLDRASAEEKQRKAALRKRPADAAGASSSSDAKRQRVENAKSSALLAGFDFTSLTSTLITEIIVANIQACPESELIALVEAYKTKNLVPAKMVVEGRVAVPATEEQEEAMEIDDEDEDEDAEELEYSPEALNMKLSGTSAPGKDVDAEEEAEEKAAAEVKAVALRTGFELPPPRNLESEEERMEVLRASVMRVCEADQSDMAMLLVIRLLTRVVDPEVKGDGKEEDDGVVELYMRQDKMRHRLCDYIMADFPNRMRIAVLWMNEEWYNDELRLRTDPEWPPNYETWLGQVMSQYQSMLDAKDRTFWRFILELPFIPEDLLHTLRGLCEDTERMHIGFNALREFVVLRPPLRNKSLSILLELTTHPEKVTRNAAIITVKRWVPDVKPMCDEVRDYAIGALRRLQQKKPKSKPLAAAAAKPTAGVNGDVQMNGNADAEMKDGEEKQPSMEKPDVNMDEEEEEEPQAQSLYLPDVMELPAQQPHVLQHVELLFSLSVKDPELLDEMFAAYCHMEPTVQEAIQELITGLVKALGPTHGKLLTLMRTCPVGAESLALRVLAIFTKNGRLSPQLVACVKALINERDLDARFLVYILPEMDKADIRRHLPRIVSTLDGTPGPKAIVRDVFSGIVDTSSSFGGNSNLPRHRSSELLSPPELMVLLHHSESEIGLKSAIEAIGICFSMTTVFTSDVLGVVMQQLLDEPTLPVLFLRTVIQAVTTYKSLAGFVSTTLLSRLITKKIWTNAPLWIGFMRLAKTIAPGSFPALLQLPKEQLRELVDKQPTLKAGLRDYVTKKAPNRTARVNPFLDIFGDEPAAAAEVTMEEPVAVV